MKGGVGPKKNKVGKKKKKGKNCWNNLPSVDGVANVDNTKI